jgi:hypothetical protein
LTLRPADSFAAYPAWFVAVKAGKFRPKPVKTEENRHNSHKIFK